VTNVGRKIGGKRLLGRSRRRWEVNIRMDIREIGWEGVEWMHLNFYISTKHVQIC
jgi:hypothetical protein